MKPLFNLDLLFCQTFNYTERGRQHTYNKRSDCNHHQARSQSKFRGSLIEIIISQIDILSKIICIFFLFLLKISTKTIYKIYIYIFYDNTKIKKN